MESNKCLALAHRERLVGGLALAYGLRLTGGPAPTRGRRLMGIFLRTMGRLTRGAGLWKVLLSHIRKAYGRYHMPVTLSLVLGNQNYLESNKCPAYTHGERVTREAYNVASNHNFQPSILGLDLFDENYVKLLPLAKTIHFGFA
ncbi:hypothetical protein GOBAR_DD13245 [Gossypium barbadense]|nr:hypothetical protein GOBAR_DD13245 [Gossypium barbadense]